MSDHIEDDEHDLLDEIDDGYPDDDYDRCN